LGLFFKNYQKNLYCISPFLEAKAGAKIKYIFETAKYLMIFFQKTFSKSLLTLSERFPFLIAGAKVAIKSKFASLLLNIFRNYYIFLITDVYTYINICKGRESKTSGDMWVKWIYYTQNDRQTLLNYL
jgi:hypothetical protein